ncbi:MAG: L-serine ammonia-lyase [Myxococcota bacterium]
MHLSAFDLFSVGIGPSSSHTVGPMRAAKRVRDALLAAPSVNALRVELFGSLGATGRGHGTDRAIIAGLLGHEPETVEPDSIGAMVDAFHAASGFDVAGRTIHCGPKALVFHRRKSLPLHPNAMRFTALGDDSPVWERTFYSVGGGFIRDEGDEGPGRSEPPHPFSTGNELLDRCESTGFSISTIMRRNEESWQTTALIDAGLDEIWRVMKACVVRGCEREGVLPGGLKVRRRAPSLLQRLRHEASGDPLRALDWVNLWALAVNEENAAGGRVVTAPTNGAAGIIPAVLHYYERFCTGADTEGVRRFLLAAAAVALVVKKNASISGAEMGCQGEVGVACAMAAAGLCEVLGGTPNQVECAAEIGLEHNLGLTCDPVGGLVQVPCIERNAMGSVKAINAARLALRGDGHQKVSLDQVVRTMRQTGHDMKTKYKETARGGLAVHIVEC